MPRSVTAVTTRRGRTPTGTQSRPCSRSVLRVEAFPCDPAVVGVDVAADHPRRLESRRVWAPSERRKRSGGITQPTPLATLTVSGFSPPGTALLVDIASVTNLFLYGPVFFFTPTNSFSRPLALVAW